MTVMLYHSAYAVWQFFQAANEFFVACKVGGVEGKKTNKKMLTQIFGVARDEERRDKKTPHFFCVCGENVTSPWHLSHDKP